MIAPAGSQQNLQTITQWRYCRRCERSAPKRKLAGDTIWACLWCFAHEDAPASPQSVQTSAPDSAPSTSETEEPGQT